MSVGYAFNAVDLSASLGIQSSSLTPNVKNVTGSFDRNFLSFTLKRNFLLPSRSSFFCVGAGAGIYASGKLDLGLAPVGDGDWEIRYHDGLGLHLLMSLEVLAGRCAISAGLKFTRVSYTAKSFQYNGVPYPTSSLEHDFQTIVGDGVDLFAAVKF